MVSELVPLLHMPAASCTPCDGGGEGSACAQLGLTAERTWTLPAALLWSLSTGCAWQPHSGATPCCMLTHAPDAGRPQDGKRHGVGVKAYADGSTFNGFWQDGNKHGVGVFRPAKSEKDKDKEKEKHGALGSMGRMGRTGSGRLVTSASMPPSESSQNLQSLETNSVQPGGCEAGGSTLSPPPGAHVCFGGGGGGGGEGQRRVTRIGWVRAPRASPPFNRPIHAGCPRSGSASFLAAGL